ncbi:MAG: protease modulator HflC [Acidimicrobiales bacterium]|nr:MAG: protease modulator HflC [Acidimicrobiales bacterium]
MKSLSTLVIAAIVAVVILFFCTFTVNQWSQALVLEFGQAQRVENAWGEEPDAGLKFKKPWEKVVTLDRRNLEIDLKPVELLAADQERMVVDAFVRYRILDAVKFYETLRNEIGAQQKLQSIMDSTLRDVLGRVETAEIISGRRAELMAEIQSITNATAQDETNDLGVEIIDVRIKRADLPKENAERVFARMITERNQRAAQIRAEGEKRSREIRATAEKTDTVTVANAQEQSSKIKGQGDAERNKTYADAYNLDPEFFAFYRSMEAYKKGLTKGTTYVLSPDSDFLGYLDDQQGPR